MLVAAFSIKLLIYNSHSLKDKRSVVKSVKERLRNRFNISVAETGFLDQHNYAEIGVAVVGSENHHLEEIINQAISFIETDSRFEVVEVTRVI